MNQARNLLQDLAVIGATVEPAGTRLILRAGPTAIPATLVRRVKEAKSDLIAMLAGWSDPVAEQKHRSTIPGTKPIHRVSDRSMT